jgi:hypothetical protein
LSSIRITNSGHFTACLKRTIDCPGRLPLPGPGSSQSILGFAPMTLSILLLHLLTLPIGIDGTHFITEFLDLPAHSHWAGDQLPIDDLLTPSWSKIGSDSPHFSILIKFNWVMAYNKQRLGIPDNCHTPGALQGSVPSGLAERQSFLCGKLGYSAQDNYCVCFFATL